MTKDIAESTDCQECNEFDDVQDFHRKFGVKGNLKPGLLGPELADFRIAFFKEESKEFEDAVRQGDLIEMVDACIDLIYIAYGTLDLMGIDKKTFQACWDEVQRANMSKLSGLESRVRGILTTKPPRHDLDVLKPVTWIGPDFSKIPGLDQ